MTFSGLGKASRLLQGHPRIPYTNYLLVLRSHPYFVYPNSYKSISLPECHTRSGSWQLNVGKSPASSGKKSARRLRSPGSTWPAAAAGQCAVDRRCIFVHGHVYRCLFVF